MNMKAVAVLTFCLCALGLVPLTWTIHVAASEPSTLQPKSTKTYSDLDAAGSDLTAEQVIANGQRRFIELQRLKGANRQPQAQQARGWDPDGRKVSALSRSLLAGLSTSVGAAAVLLLSATPTAAQMAFALSLAGGVMVTVSVVELWMPHMLEPGWRLQAIFFSALGALGFYALSLLVPEPDYISEADIENGAVGEKDKDAIRKGKQWRLAVIMMLALTAHNFPEGLAVAISSMESERLGFVVMAAIAVHNIPEGIAIAMPVFDATKSRMRAMQMATLSGLAEPLGALVALTMLPQEFFEGRGMDSLLCVVGGIMTCVALVELFPEARAQNEPTATVAGAVTGAVVMLLTMMYA